MFLPNIFICIIFENPIPRHWFDFCVQMNVKSNVNNDAGHQFKHKKSKKNPFHHQASLSQVWAKCPNTVLVFHACKGEEVQRLGNSVHTCMLCFPDF